MELLKNLKWRYATKKFTERKVSTKQIDQLIEAINLSASSTGLQPYRIFVVENSELKERLGEGSFNKQIAECSHLIVFAALEKINMSHIEDFMNLIANQREIPVESLDDYKSALVSGILGRSEQVNFDWAARQAYIALGTALIAAAELKIDSTPMEGFDATKFDELLGLQKMGLKSVVTLAVGYRDEALDHYASLRKVRLPETEFATFIE